MAMLSKYATAYFSSPSCHAGKWQPKEEGPHGSYKSDVLAEPESSKEHQQELISHTQVDAKWLSRRCTALVFSPCNSRVLVADKSGDVFSFSVKAAEEDGRLELGHLSMLLDLVATLDGQHVITCDRDEKIRVSQWGAPHVITAFCLGHTEFVSQLALPEGREKLLLSGSGDGTLRLWRYETGQELQNCTISSIPRPEDDLEVKEFAVTRIRCCPRGEQVAVLCDGVPGIYMFSILASPCLAHPLYVNLPYAPVDLDFEDSTSLWVFSAIKGNPIQLLQYREQRWQPAPRDDRTKELSDVIGESWEQMGAGQNIECTERISPQHVDRKEQSKELSLLNWSGYQRNPREM
ncbi:unnamed protein product [Ranitomeya imitator]|uniref:WD repeat-containing protein 4 n=1 Tax=Ranitomeya imitator TaxID=111125 RepID=A0ABN9MAY4_9NEOB|nr:unnamed protein product [Ranitomeya imitator]